MTVNSGGSAAEWANAGGGGGGGVGILTAYNDASFASVDVSGALNITGVIGASGSKTHTYQYSSYNHAGAQALGYGRTNLSVANVVMLAADYIITLDSDNAIELLAPYMYVGTHGYTNSSTGVVTPPTQRVNISSINQIYTNVGKFDGTTALPSSGKFLYQVDVGGYNQTTGIQQAGEMFTTAGTKIWILSPLINIGFLNYGGATVGATNTTANINLTASTKIDLKCNQVDVQQDIKITRALSINGNYGTAGQVLTSGGSGSAMTWSSGATPGELNGVTPGVVTANKCLVVNGSRDIGTNSGPLRNVISNGTYTTSGTVTGGNIVTTGEFRIGGAVAIPASFGSAGQVLTVNSGGSAAEWANAGGGGGGGVGILTAYNDASFASVDVSGALNITGVIGASGSKTHTYQYSSYNHAGAQALGYGRTNLSVANVVMLAADYIITLDSDNAIELLAPYMYVGTHGYTNSSTGVVTPPTQRVNISSINQIYTNVGKFDGTTALPSSGKFLYQVDVGGYNQTTGIQQAGEMFTTAGTKIWILSPLINIGFLNYGGATVGATNTTANINLTASTKIDLKCNQVDVQQDIKITRALSINGNYGTAGQVLTSGGSGSAMTWSSGTTSDDRIKHNEENIINALSIIRQLKPQKYQKTSEMKTPDFMGDLSDGTFIIEAGFIAQEVMLIPDLSFAINGGGLIEVEEPDLSNPGVMVRNMKEQLYSLDYNNIFTYNVAATKELDTLVTDLSNNLLAANNRITQLENENNIIKTALNTLLAAGGHNTI